MFFVFLALPKIRISPANETKNETDGGEFACGGDGIPIPEVTWQKDNGSVIMNSSKYVIKHIDKPYNFRISYLTINDLEYADRGSYLCTFKNRKTTDFESALLVVQGKPSR